MWYVIGEGDKNFCKFSIIHDRNNILTSNDAEFNVKDRVLKSSLS